MKELRPGMSRLTPGGRPGTVCAGFGIRRALRALVTLLRSASRRPASPATAATPAVAALAARKLLRCGPGGAAWLPARTGRAEPPGRTGPPGSRGTEGLITAPEAGGRPASAGRS